VKSGEVAISTEARPVGTKPVESASSTNGPASLKKPSARKRPQLARSQGRRKPVASSIAPPASSMRAAAMAKAGSSGRAMARK
jgi:hypothetical protein